MDLYAYLEVRDGKIIGVAMAKPVSDMARPFPCVATDVAELRRMVRYLRRHDSLPENVRLYKFTGGAEIDPKSFLD